MSSGTNGHATVDVPLVKRASLEQLQEEMSVLLKELSTVQEMSPADRQRLQVRFELKSLEIKAQIIQAEHDDLLDTLPQLKVTVDKANGAVRSAQEQYRDALNAFNATDERRKRLLSEVDQIQRDCESVRLRIPS